MAQINLNDLTPAPPSAKVNVKWQAQSPPVALTITAVTNHSGACEIATSPAHGAVTGDQIFIYDPQDPNISPNLSGQWTVTVIDSTHLVLVGSTYASGYVANSALGMIALDISAYLPLTQGAGITFSIAGGFLTISSTGSGSSGGVNSQTASYAAVAGDAGKLISFNSASAVTLTLPAAASPPSTVWMIAVENVGAGNLTISPNGLNLDGSGSSLVIIKGQGVLIYTDGANYFSSRGAPPIGTTSAPGILQPDGTTITVSGSGVISSVAAGALIQLAQTTLASPASSVNFGSIPTGYTDLILSVTCKSATTTGTTGVNINFNNDSNANYNVVFLHSSGSAGFGSATGQTAINAEIANSNTSLFSALEATMLELFIPYYANTSFYKSPVMAPNGYLTVGSPYVNLIYDSWQYAVASAIASIQITTSDGSNFIAGSIFTLYGRK